MVRRLVEEQQPDVLRSDFHASGFWPAYVERAEGGHFWDVDGNGFIDNNLGAGPVMLGHAFPPVIEAVQRQLPLAQLYATSSPLELELARLIIELVPCAEMVHYARGGGEACAVAIRIARSYSRKDKALTLHSRPSRDRAPLVDRAGDRGRCGRSRAGDRGADRVPGQTVPSVLSTRPHTCSKKRNTTR